MDVREVQELVRRGQAIKASNYHAGKRGLRFLEILEALERCYLVAPDARPALPNGWYALANLPNKRRLRIDFNVQEDDAGNLLLIVTAYEA